MDIITELKKKYYPNKREKGEDFKKEIPDNAKAKLFLQLDIWNNENKLYQIAVKAVYILKPDISKFLLNKRFEDNYSNDVKANHQLGKAIYTLFIKKEEKKAFNIFIEIGLPYAVSAYYMFVYDKTKYMPLRVDIMNALFEKLDYVKLERGNYSYENYLQYMNNLKDIQNKIGGTLFDAHDYVWIVGKQLYDIKRYKN